MKTTKASEPRRPCINFTPFDADVKRKFKNLANDAGKTMSELAEEVLGEYVAKHATPKPGRRKQTA